LPNLKQEWTDHDVQILIGNLLRTGVMLAAAVVLFGGGIYLAHHGFTEPQYRVFKGEPKELCTVLGIVKGALTFQGRSLIQLGLLLLIATPVVRVAVSVGAFAVQRDRLYVAITLIVLTILLYSLTSGQG